eukprot:TRINITY_DN4664_c0_g1_i2.p1 TRINITY_DN4664_c0_g1~~TRINITY_DN4664_c0_g1_i2.p1  ORF type:complete len:939 (+),score=282.35 TRINITY_DN4664_c0_g1_i2:88-2817(+)
MAAAAPDVQCLRTGRLIVVSNRLPVSITRGPDGGFFYKRASGGLVPAVEGVSAEVAGMLWLGNPGVVVPDEQIDDVSERLLKEGGCIPVWIDEDTANEHYNGFSNAILWPLFHYKENIDFQPHAWECYVKANQKFCDKVLEVYQPGDLIWVHDYHLMLLPKLLREHAQLRGMCELSIGFFLHIPFPTSEVYRCLPWREELLEGVLDADLVGFHSYDYAQHFCRSCQRLLHLEFQPGKVHYRGRDVQVHVYPVGLNFDKIAQGLQAEDVAERVRELRTNFDGQQVLIGVDRLDYIKGIPQKLQALERVFQDNPSRIGKLVLLQIAVPSREDVEEYQILRREVETLVGRINARYSRQDTRAKAFKIARGSADDRIGFEFVGSQVVSVTPRSPAAAAGIKEGFLVSSVNGVAVESHDDVVEALKAAPADFTLVAQVTRLISPVYYLYKSVPFYQLLAMYSVADACLVTSLRDGMNLVCQEYVVCQGENHGVLVLSEFTGSARCLASAIRVNPWNIAEVADAIEMAVDMSAEERRDRHVKMYSYVSKHGATHWGRTFLRDFAMFAQREAGLVHAPLLSAEAVVCDFVAAPRRLLIIGLDSALTDLRTCSGVFDVPTIPPATADVLRKLCATPGTSVVVWSERERGQLDAAARSLRIDGLYLVAERGYFFRAAGAPAGEEEWTEVGVDMAEYAGRDAEWWDDASEVLSVFTAGTPGSRLLDGRSATLGWSWAGADAFFGPRQAQECHTHLHGRSCRSQGGSGDAKGYNLLIDYDRKLLEVVPKGLTTDYTLSKMLPVLADGSPPGTPTSTDGRLPPNTSIFSARSSNTAPSFDICVVVGADVPGDSFSCGHLHRDAIRHCKVHDGPRDGRRESPARHRGQGPGVVLPRVGVFRLLEQLVCAAPMSPAPLSPKPV